MSVPLLFESGSWYLAEEARSWVPAGLGRAAAGTVGTAVYPFRPGSDGGLHPDEFCTGADLSLPVEHYSYLEVSRLGVPFRCPDCSISQRVVDLEASLSIFGIVARAEELLALPVRTSVVVGELLRLGAVLADLSSFVTGIDPVAASEGLRVLSVLESFHASLPCPEVPDGPVSCVWVPRLWFEVHPLSPLSVESWYTFVASLGSAVPFSGDVPGRAVLVSTSVLASFEGTGLSALVSDRELSREQLELFTTLVEDEPGRVLERDWFARTLQLVRLGV